MYRPALRLLILSFCCLLGLGDLNAQDGAAYGSQLDSIQSLLDEGQFEEAHAQSSSMLSISEFLTTEE